MTCAQPDPQIPLLTVPPRYNITSNAQARNAYGSAAQEIVCAALHVTPIPINGNKEVCFDAAGDGVNYEIKSVQHNGKVAVYDWRMKKEERWVKEGKGELRYAILVHRVRGHRNGGTLIETLAEKGLSLIVVPFSVVHQEASTESLRQMKTAVAVNTRNGYQRRGYKDGYRNISIRKIMSRCRLQHSVPFSLYGRNYELTLHHLA